MNNVLNEVTKTVGNWYSKLHFPEGTIAVKFSKFVSPEEFLERATYEEQTHDFFWTTSRGTYAGAAVFADELQDWWLGNKVELVMYLPCPKTLISFEVEAKGTLDGEVEYVCKDYDFVGKLSDIDPELYDWEFDRIENRGIEMIAKRYIKKGVTNV